MYPEMLINIEQSELEDRPSFFFFFFFFLGRGGREKNDSRDFCNFPSTSNR